MTIPITKKIAKVMLLAFSIFLIVAEIGYVKASNMSHGPFWPLAVFGITGIISLSIHQYVAWKEEGRLPKVTFKK